MTYSELPDIDKLQAEQDVEGLVKALFYEGDREVRIRAATALGQIGGAQAIEPLTSALKDKNQLVCRAAATALGQIGEARAVEPLLTSLRDNEDSGFLQAVVEAVTRIAGLVGMQVANTLIQYLADDNTTVRMVTIAAMKKVGVQAVEPLIDVLQHKGYPACQGAAKVLGAIGDIRAVKPLIDALKDENSIMRGTAASALAKIGDKRAVEPLIAALDDINPYVGKAVAETIRQIGGAEAAEPLMRYEERAEAKKREARIHELVGRLRPRTVPVFDDRGEDIAITMTVNDAIKAAEELGQIGEARTVKPLVNALFDESIHLKKAAAEALEKIGIPAVEQLIDTLINVEKLPLRELEVYRIMVCAADTLGRIGDIRAVKPLIYVLTRDYGGEVHWAATTALAKIGIPAAELLVNMYITDKGDRVRFRIETALRRIVGSRVRQLIDAPNEEEKEAAAKALLNSLKDEPQHNDPKDAQ